AQHPLRPPKPPGGTLFYLPMRAVLGLHVSDPGSKEDMNAFRSWMNDERVNSGWGEKGSWEKHVEYVRGVVDDPHVLPLIKSWDSAQMGYVELDNHVVPYVPAGTQDYDRGYSPARTAQAWFRSITNYIFLAEARTAREPKRPNAALVRTSVDGSMHLETSFYFPYKHSVMTMNARSKRACSLSKLRTGVRPIYATAVRRVIYRGNFDKSIKYEGTPETERYMYVQLSVLAYIKKKNRDKHGLVPWNPGVTDTGNCETADGDCVYAHHQPEVRERKTHGRAQSLWGRTSQRPHHRRRVTRSRSFHNL
ncbi:hypothetical protein DFH11DRAFT_1512971, partial [Phellopilus nigrolimitatus]